MHKNAIAYFISFFFSGIVLFCFFPLEYPILYVLWSVGVVLGTAGLIGLGLYAKRNQILDEETSILWAFNEERNDRLTALLAGLKGVLILLFAAMCLIPVKHIVIDQISLAVLIALVVLVIEKAMSACYKFDDYEIKYSSWEGELTKAERIMLYKSRVTFFTMGILPLILCCLYGEIILRILFAFFSFMIPFLLGHIYPVLFNRNKMKKK